MYKYYWKYSTGGQQVYLEIVDSNVDSTEGTQILLEIFNWGISPVNWRAVDVSGK